MTTHILRGWKNLKLVHVVHPYIEIIFVKCGRQRSYFELWWLPKENSTQSKLSIKLMNLINIHFNQYHRSQTFYVLALCYIKSTRCYICFQRPQSEINWVLTTSSSSSSGVLIVIENIYIAFCARNCFKCFPYINLFNLPHILIKWIRLSSLLQMRRLKLGKLKWLLPWS